MTQNASTTLFFISIDHLVNIFHNFPFYKNLNKLEVASLSAFLRNNSIKLKMDEDLGLNLKFGVAIVGPPGCGKTTFAVALN